MVERAVVEIEKGLADKDSKRAFEAGLKALLDRLRGRRPRDLELFSRGVVRAMLSSRLETRVAAFQFCVALLSLVPDKLRHEFEGLVDELEFEVSPAALQSLAGLSRDDKGEFSSVADSYKTDLLAVCAFTALSLFELVKGRFAGGRGLKGRNFKALFGQVEVSGQLRARLDRLGACAANPLDGKASLFKKKETVRLEGLFQAVEEALREAEATRLAVVGLLQEEHLADRVRQLMDSMEAYGEQMLRLKEAVGDKAALLSEAQASRRSSAGSCSRTSRTSSTRGSSRTSGTTRPTSWASASASSARVSAPCSGSSRSPS